MKAFLIAAAAAFCLSMPVAAVADEDTSPAPAAAPAAMVDWSGPYAGFGAGYDFGHVKVTDIDGYNGPPPIKYNPDGVNITAVLGYNWALDSDWLVGAEGEIGWFGFEGRAQYPPYIGVRAANDSVASINGRFLTTLTGRFGYTYGNWLAFAKAGYVGSDIRVRYVDYDTTGTVLVSGTDLSRFRSGYTVGGGIEFLLPSGDTSTRIEYDRYDFGDISQTTTSIGGSVWHFRHSVTSNVVKVIVAIHW